MCVCVCVGSFGQPSVNSVASLALFYIILQKGTKKKIWVACMQKSHIEIDFFFGCCGNVCNIQQVRNEADKILKNGYMPNDQVTT